MKFPVPSYKRITLAKRRLRLHPFQQKAMEAERGKSYWILGDASYHVSSSFLDALWKGFAEIGNGLFAAFSAGEYIDPNRYEILDRTNEEAIVDDWRVIGDDIRAVLDTLPELRRDRYQLKNKSKKKNTKKQ